MTRILVSHIIAGEGTVFGIGCSERCLRRPGAASNQAPYDTPQSQPEDLPPLQAAFHDIMFFKFS